MNKEDIIRKITSRKFIGAVAAFVVSLLVILGVISVDKKEEIYALIMMGGTIVAYIIGEGITDIAHAKQPIEEIEYEDGDEQWKAE